MTKRKKQAGRVPVILQMSTVECGAACLAMILSYFGRKTRLEECREKCDAGRDGVTAQTLASAARAFGLRAKGVRSSAAAFAGIPTPAILHWNFSHFVVLERWSPDYVDIVDPAWGRRRIDRAEFDSAFSGVSLTFEPGPALEARNTASASLPLEFLKRILHTPGARRTLVEILVASGVLQALTFALPLFTKVVVDRLLPQQRLTDLNMLGLAALVAAATYAGVSYFRAVLLIRLQSRLDSCLMLEFFDHLLALPFRFFQRRNSGDLLMRLASNSTIREALATYTVSTVLDSVLVLVSLAALLRVAPLPGMSALAIACLEVVILLATSKRLHALVESELCSQSESQSFLIESLMGICTIKASGTERRIFKRWSGLLEKQLETSARRNYCGARVDAAVTGLRTLAPLGLLWLGAVEVVNGSMSLGTMLAVNALAATFLLPVGSLVASLQRFQLARAYLERIADVMQAEPEQRSGNLGDVPRLSGRIELRGVSFRYDAHSRKVLDNVWLTIHPGQKVALVGRTGSGKSTLAKLLLGLYLPTEGQILYDGIPLESLSYPAVRRQWGVVLQEPFLFSSSIRENISLYNPDLTADELIEAAGTAGIHDDIVDMPMAYETRIDEGGTSLSGGQRQRLAIARAIAGAPPMVLLDEATSHLDVVTESRVDRNLDAMSCTRLVVAHRLSTVRSADLILVLDQGAIVERGSHEELLASGGLYAALVRSQLKDVGEAQMHSV